MSKLAVVRAGAWCCIVLAALAACASDPDPADVEGITTDEDGLFRGTDLPGAEPDRVYDLARRIVRTRFAGARLEESPERRTITTERGFSAAPRKIEFYLQVTQLPGGARVSVYAPQYQMRDDLADHPNDDPWEFFGQDFYLENSILQEVYDEVLVRLMPAPPAPPANR